MGTSDKASSWLSSDTTNTSVSYDENGTTISSEVNTGSRQYHTLMGNTKNWRDTNKNYCIEMDIIFGRQADSDGGAGYIAIGGGYIETYRLGAYPNSGHLKVETEGITIKFYWNGDYMSSLDRTMSTSEGFYLSFYRKAWITFKNLIIYEI